MSEQMRIMRSKELPEELRDRIVARHRSGQGYKKNSAALKVPKSTVASIILKWKTFGTTRTLPRAGRLAKLSYRGRRALVREAKKNPKITVAELSGALCIYIYTFFILKKKKYIYIMYMCVCIYMCIYIYSGYGKYSDPLKFFTLCYIAAIC